MTLRVSPLGLPLEYPVLTPPTKVPVSGQIRMGALGLAYVRGDNDSIVPVTSPAATTGAGAVVASGGGAFVQFAQVGPLALSGPLRTITAKSGNISIAVTGVEARAQGEELEGASVTIRIDGASVATQAGVVAASDLITIDQPTRRTSITMTTRRVMFSGTSEVNLF